jgi:hypothetical protein
VAGSSIAKADEVPPATSQPELGVESDHAIDSALRDAETLGNVVLKLAGQVAVDLLRLVENRNEGAAPGILPDHEGIQFWTVGFQIEAHVRSWVVPIANDQSAVIGHLNFGVFGCGPRVI